MRSPSWSPDGRLLAFLSLHEEGRTEIVTLPAEGGEEHTLGEFEGASRTAGLTWMPDGRGLLFLRPNETGLRTQQLWFQPFPRGPARPVTNDANYYDHPSVSADGSVIVATRHAWSFSLWVVSSEGEAAEHQVFPEHLLSPMSWADLDWLDEDRLVVALHDASGAGLRVLDLSSGQVQNPAWPSGGFRAPRVVRSAGRLLLHEDPPGGWLRSGSRLVELDLESGGVHPLAESVSYCCTHAAPDGDSVWFLERGDEPSRLRRWDRETGDVEAAWSEPISWYTLSADGRRIGWNPDAPEVRSFEDGTEIVGPSSAVASWSGYFVLSPSGEAVAEVSDESGSANLWRREIPSGEARQLTRFEDGNIGSIRWSPSGTRIAFVLWRVHEDVMLLRTSPSEG